MQAERNTTGFKSNCWPLHTSVTRAKGGQSQHLHPALLLQGGECECVGGWCRIEKVLHPQ